MRLAALLFLTLCFQSGLISAQVKTPEPPAVKAPFDSSLQIVVVTTKDWNTVQGTARLFERKTGSANWNTVGNAFPVVVGRGGLAWGEDSSAGASPVKVKKEGDGNSPAGRFPLTSAFGTGTKPVAVELSYTKLDRYTECVDDVRSTFYNRLVNRMKVGNFDWKSSEKMLAVGEQYALGLFVGYNSFPVKRGEGSCIFMHIWKDDATGTAGCTAMERRNLERIVAWASPQKNPYLVQLPENVYNKIRKSWNLPKFK